jgi:MPBQ/MSBQ methyltransferase
MNKVTRYQNAALQYYLEMVGSPYLHYGYWEPMPTSTDELTVGGLRKAQESYASHLLSFIPTNTHSILDVGCGIGGNAANLLKQGFKVEGLAPDAFQKEKFVSRTGGAAPFHLSTFEQFVEIAKASSTPPSYDLLLFSESSQYMSSKDIAEGAAQLTSSGGYVLLADMLRTNAEYREGIFSNCHVSAELKTAMEGAGFKLVKSEDISTQIAPTIDICVQSFQMFGLSTIRYVANLAQIAVPPIYSLLRYFLRDRLKKLVTEGVEASTLFKQHLSYEIQLWQLSETAAK